MRYIIRRLGMILLAVGIILWPLSSSVSAERSIIEYQLPTAARPFDIVQGSDGALWFTDSGTNAIGRISDSGVISEFSIPTDQSGPLGITAGPDGALWFTEEAANKIGRITTDGNFSEYPITLAGSSPAHLAVGTDGALWFTQTSANAIGRITTDGAITEYSATSTNTGIAAGPDGALWFTSTAENVIGRLGTDGSLTTYQVPTPSSDPVRITAGPDGALWFTENGNNAGSKIGRVMTDGAITEYSLPASAAGPYALTTGTDAQVWFTSVGGNEIGSLSPTGSIAEYPIPTGFSSPSGITSAANGDLWFTETNTGKIGRLMNVAGASPDATALSLTPASQDSQVNTSTSFMATAYRSDQSPAANVTIRFDVSGSTTKSGSCITNTAGQCSFSYIGPLLPGANAITAYADNDVDQNLDAGEPIATATQAWFVPLTTAGQVTGGGHINDMTDNDTAAFGFTARSNQNGLSGQCEVIDDWATTDVKCTDVTSLTVSGSNATFFGHATINGIATTYRIDVSDNATSGAGIDTFSIQTDTGFRASGILADGNVTVH